jgi:SOS-response transcriptional repressor LexA
MFDTLLARRKPKGSTVMDHHQARELAVLSVFAAYGDRAGPSVREIAHAIGAANDTVVRVLGRLAANGEVERIDQPTALRHPARAMRRAARSYRLTRNGAKRLGHHPPAAAPPLATTGRPPLLPVMGELAAGQPIDTGGLTGGLDGADHTLLDVLAPDPGDQVFRVRGHSMLDAGIRDGDYVVIRPQAVTQARDGDLVVAAVTEWGVEEITLKYLARGNGRVRLTPANATGTDWQGHPYKSRTYDPADVRILGVLRWVIKRH